MSIKTILAVDDEEHILELITYNLENAGYKVVKADTGERALELLEANEIDLALLDMMLPGIDGIEVLRNIRINKQYKKLPIIFLTAKSDEISKVVGLELGADDYLTKPFGVHELLARIKALLRRTEGSLQADKEDISDQEEKKEKEEITKIDHIIINKTRRSVIVDNVTVELSLKEFEVLYLLAKNRGIVFSRESLLEKIWGYDYCGETRTVDVHIRNLRKKIEKDDNNPTYLKTIRGIGYKFS